ncbi:MAG: ABC transporter ATP-binding protein [Agathobacter sp.]|nr:ABC transporter ATP-binding protein [Agathobacter sp.]
MEEIRQRNDSIVSNAWFLAKESWRWDKRILLFLAVTTLTGIALPLFGIYLPKVAVDLLLQKAETARVLQVLGSMVGGVLILQGLHGYLSKRAYFHHNECRNTFFVQRLFLVSLQCKYSYAEDGEFYKLYRRAINSVRSGDESGTSVFFDLIPQMITGAACFFLYSGILSRLHFLVIVFLLATSLVTYFFRRRENACYERTRDDYALAEKRLYYTIGECGDSRTGKDVRVYNMKGWLTRQIQRFQAEEREILKTRRRKEYETHLVNCWLNFLRDGFAYAYLIVQTVQGKIGMGDFMLFFGAITGFSIWVTGLVDQMSRIKTANVKMNDLRTFLDIPAEDTESAECGMPDISDGVEIEFEHVSFAYPGSEKDVISDLSFRIGKREHVALVGLNGAGKSTLLKLMMGMYEPSKGTIRLNGVDITKLKKRDVYRLYSAVFQETMILPAMIDENIALRPKRCLDRDRVEEVIRLSGLDADFARRNITLDSYMTDRLVEDGIYLSGGQEQKFLLARALYKDAPVLLLDEPTAALDPLAEQEVYESYQKLCRNRTALFISHRLASTQFSDWIMFLQDGKIIEQGNHEELLAAGGEYARLYELQSYYYNLEEGQVREEAGYECEQ